MTVPTKICSACGLTKPLTKFHRDKSMRDGYKARCKACQSTTAAEYYTANSVRIRADQRERYAETGGNGRVRTVTMRYCPDDRELRRPMFDAPCLFSRGGFRETLAAGYWPTGSIFDFALEYRGEVSQWRVNGSYLLEVDGERVAFASLAGDDHVRVALVETAIAAKGR